MGQILASTSANVTFTQLADTQGRMILVPESTIHALLAEGVTQETFVISLPKPSERYDLWPRIKDAAVQLMEDTVGLHLPAARERIARAVQAGHLRVVNTPHGRRIDPTTLGAWRLRQREQDLDRAS